MSAGSGHGVSTPKSGLSSTYARRGDAVLGLATTLSLGVDTCAIGVLSDSTGVPDTAWPRLIANSLAADYPAYTVHVRKWNDTSQDFDRPVVVQTGTDGRRAAVMGSGGTRVGRIAVGDGITGDIDVRLNLQPPAAWASGSTCALASRWPSDTDASWIFYLSSTGNLRITWSTDGAITWEGDKSSTAAVPFADGAEGWVRVVLDVDNGAGGHDVKFYTSTDGASWTQLGSTVTTAGATSLWAGSSTNAYSIGARGNGTNSPLPALTKLYEVQIRDGIAGPCVTPVMADLWGVTIGANAGTIEGAPVLTFVVGAMSGAGLGYEVWGTNATGYLNATTARIQKMTPNLGQVVTFVSTGHNEYDLNSDGWTSKLAAYITAATARTTGSARVVLTQNPRTGASDTPGAKRRRGQTIAWAQRAAGVDVIDTYAAFLADGRDLDLLVDDGVHPTSAGYQVWADAILAEVDAAVARVA